MQQYHTLITLIHPAASKQSTVDITRTLEESAIPSRLGLCKSITSHMSHVSLQTCFRPLHPAAGQTCHDRLRMRYIYTRSVIQPAR